MPEWLISLDFSPPCDVIYEHLRIAVIWLVRTCVSFTLISGRNVLDYVKERSPNCYRCCVRQAGFNSIAGRDKVSVSRSLKVSIERARLNSYVADILEMYITSHSVLKVLRIVRLSLVNSWRQMVWKEHSWNACNEPM